MKQMPVTTVTADIAIVGGGGAGLRAAIAAAELNPSLKIALISKVYPMRSHTVAAEGGAAAVTLSEDTAEAHFNDTVTGGDWLVEQSVADYFVRNAYRELVQLEHWGCPWSRKTDGDVQVRRFGGMKTERTWFAADKTGFHILHTLFQTSLKYPNIQRLDEYFVLDLIVSEGQIAGVLALQINSGRLVYVRAKSVILATGGAGRLFQYNTNAGIVTGEGMGMAYRHGVALRDMEFVQYHPTGLPGSGILITEACRGEGGVLVNREGHRYLQDYGLGPETPLGQPQNKTMELGPRDKLSQAFWHEQQLGRTDDYKGHAVVHLDLRHLGAKLLAERLPLISELARAYVNVDPVTTPIPVRPAAHYTMGGITTDVHCDTTIGGLYAAGECASVGLHGANRLGSNSLSEILVFGRVAGEQAAQRAEQQPLIAESSWTQPVKAWETRLSHLLSGQTTESVSAVREDMTRAMELGCGIFRDADALQHCLDTLVSLRARFQQLRVRDRSRVFNSELLQLIELDSGLDLAMAMCSGALARKESRGAHQRLESDMRQRNDSDFLQHSLAIYRQDELPQIHWQAVDTSKLPPGERVYGKSDRSSNNPQGSAS
jgi:fumarate reductase flavoprotein subunit